MQDRLYAKRTTEPMPYSSGDMEVPTLRRDSDLLSSEDYVDCSFGDGEVFFAGGVKVVGNGKVC